MPDDSINIPGLTDNAELMTAFSEDFSIEYTFIKTSAIKSFGFDIKAKKININIPSLTSEQYDTLQKFIREYYKVENGIILTEQSNRLFTSINDFRESRYYLDTMNKYKDVIPKDDWNALGTSLYIKKAFELEKNVFDLKNQIRHRFGSRGSFIANLCTSGYFHNEFPELLKRLGKNDFSEFYETVISNQLLALFIHKGLTKKTIISTIIEKSTIGLNHGIDKLRIYGIGDSNLNVMTCIHDNKKDINFIKYTELYEDEHNRNIIELSFKLEPIL